MINVLANRLSRTQRVAGGNFLEQIAVLDARHFGVLVNLNVETQVGLHRFPESLYFRAEPGHARELVDPVMEGLVPWKPLVDLRIRPFKSSQHQFELVAGVFLNVSGSLGGSEHLERSSDLEELTNLISGQPRDDRATIAAECD